MNQKIKDLLLACLVMCFCALFLFYKYILQVSPSVMTNQLMIYFHIHATGLGNLAATFFYSYLVVQLFAGPLLDKYNPSILMTVAIVICAVGTLFFATSPHLWLALTGRMLVGAGAAFATVGYLKMASIYFSPHRFALVGGLLATFAMIGAVLGETPFAYLVESYGWQSSLFYIAIAGFLIAFLFYLITQIKSNICFVENTQVKTRDFMKVLKNKNNWLLAFYSGLAFSPVVVFGGLWGNPFLQEEYLISKIAAANYSSLLFIGLGVGGPVFGWLSDKYLGRYNAMMLGSSLSLFALMSVLYLHPPLWLLAMLLFLFGFGTGAFMLGFVMGKELNSALLAGTVIALINTGDAIFGAITEPFVGKLLDFFWQGKMVNHVHYYSIASYQKALSILVAYLLAALALVFVLRKKYRG